MQASGLCVIDAGKRKGQEHRQEEFRKSFHFQTPCSTIDVRRSAVFRSRLQRDLLFRPSEDSEEVSGFSLYISSF
jgi:hypothetical protein